MTRMKCVLAVVAAIALASGVQAQRQPGGRGGFGMGQSVYVAAATNAELQKELKITDDQKKSLKDVVTKSEELNKKMQEAFSGGSGREAMQGIQEERTKMNEEAKGVVEKALSADQKKRIKEIEVQAMGLRAFTNEDVVKGLKITDDQKEKLKGIADDINTQQRSMMQEFLGGGGPPDQEKMAEMQKKQKELIDKAMDQAKKTLTDDQTKAWKEMTGAAFDVSKLNPPMRRRDN